MLGEAEKSIEDSPWKISDYLQPLPSYCIEVITHIWSREVHFAYTVAAEAVIYFEKVNILSSKRCTQYHQNRDENMNSIVKWYAGHFFQDIGKFYTVLNK